MLTLLLMLPPKWNGSSSLAQHTSTTPAAVGSGVDVADKTTMKTAWNPIRARKTLRSHHAKLSQAMCLKVCTSSRPVRSLCPSEHVDDSDNGAEVCNFV